MDKKITSLSKFPTEVLLMNFRKQRFCDTKLPWGIEEHFNHGTNQYEFWEVFLGPFEINGVVYDNMPIGYTKIACGWKERLQILKKYTKTYSSAWYSNEVQFNFEGMYWKGDIDELKAELDTRENVPLKGSKEFRRWKMKYKKSLKN